MNKRNIVRHGQLSNGVRFYAQYERGSKELITIAAMVGSFYDPPNKKGLAHVVEHALSVETKAHSDTEVNRLLRRTCGDIAEYWYITTDRTSTTYGSSNLLKKRHARTLFHMFAEMVKNPVVRKKTIEIEKSAVHQESYLTGDDVLLERMENMLSKIIFPKNHLARIPIDGDMNHVRTITLTDIKNFVDRYYVPANIIVVYFGPRYEEVKTLVAREFGDWKTDTQPRAYPYSFKEGEGGFYPLIAPVVETIIMRDTQQHHALIGFPTETYMSKDAEALDVLASILQRRMFEKLRLQNTNWQRGTYRTPVFTERTCGHGLFKFHFASLDEQFLREGIQNFHAECRELGNNLVTREEVETTIGFMYDYVFHAWLTIDPISLMEETVAAVSNGDVRLKKLHARGDCLLRLLKRGGREKLREVAKKYFSGHSATVIAKSQN